MKVKIVDAPGYEDFEGELILDDGQWQSVVVICEDDEEMHVVPRIHVEPA